MSSRTDTIQFAGRQRFTALSTEDDGVPAVYQNKKVKPLGSQSKCAPIALAVAAAVGIVILGLGASEMFGAAGSAGFIGSLAGGGGVALVSIGGMIWIALSTRKDSQRKVFERIDDDSAFNVNNNNHFADDDSAFFYHSVQAGETPHSLAQHYGVSKEEILRLNHLDESSATTLRVGRRLKIPSNPPLFPPSANNNDLFAPPLNYRLHTIQRGEDPHSLARYYGVSKEEILRLNDLTDATARQLQVGQELRIPNITLATADDSLFD